jgi:LAS superfamily LD-carboxypeptidase LdcB
MRKAPTLARFLARIAALLLLVLCRPAGAAPHHAPDLTQAAQVNAQSLSTLAFAPFGRPEVGWAVYAPLVGHELGTQADADTPDFAAALSAWQSDHGLAATGIMDAATFSAFKAVWQSRRPFVAVSRVACPPAPPETALATAPPRQSYGGKTLRLRARALAAYERLFAEARTEVAAVRADPRLLTLFSAYRSPDYDAARCLKENNCQGVTRAACSAHRTALAVDIYLGSAPGFPPDSSDDGNRLAIAKGAAYRWLIANAARFGFVPYAFEPWHWEWTGEPVTPAAVP